MYVICYNVGMAHRGRMNVLVNFFKKPIISICNNFNETEPSELGDVKVSVVIHQT